MEQNQTTQFNQDKKDDKKKKISIRTYRGDLSKIIKDQKVSVADMLVAEDKKKKNRFVKKISTETKKNLSLVIVSLILIGGGIAAFVILEILKPVTVIEVQEVELNPLIYTEYQKNLYFEKLSKTKISKKVQDEVTQLNLPLGAMIHLYLTEDSLNEKGQIIGKKLVTFSQFAQALDFRVSEKFLRFIDPNFLFGYHSTTQNSPYLILKTSSFENTFLEMLNWEDTLLEDLRPIFIEDNPALAQNRLRENIYKFKDIVVDNKDVRAVLDGGGKILFAYSFVDEKTIVITTNKNTLQEIFSRIETSYHTRE